MAKTNGLGMSASLDDSGGVLRDISTDVHDLQWATPRASQDITGIDKSALERQLLLADFTCTLSGVFDAGSNLAHAVLKTMSSTSVARTLTIVAASQTLSNEVLITDYQLTRTDSGELNWSAPLALQSGIAPTWT